MSYFFFFLSTEKPFGQIPRRWKHTARARFFFPPETEITSPGGGRLRHVRVFLYNHGEDKFTIATRNKKKILYLWKGFGFSRGRVQRILKSRDLKTLYMFEKSFRVQRMNIHSCRIWRYQHNR